MDQCTYLKIITEQTERALWEVRSIIDSVPDEEMLLEKPENCEYTRFTLILAQHRHLHSHMGMLMGFLIADAGIWPRVLGLEQPIPKDSENLDNNE